MMELCRMNWFSTAFCCNVCGVDHVSVECVFVLLTLRFRSLLPDLFHWSIPFCLQGNPSAFSVLGFTRQLMRDYDGAIEMYHQALSRKPDDPFCTEMLNRAFEESVSSFSKMTVGASSKSTAAGAAAAPKVSSASSSSSTSSLADPHRPESARSRRSIVSSAGPSYNSSSSSFVMETPRRQSSGIGRIGTGRSTTSLRSNNDMTFGLDDDEDGIIDMSSDVDMSMT